MNILVGDNEVGKSTVLEAINIVASGNIKRIESIGLDKLFNIAVVQEFNSGERTFENLPNMIIELYLKVENNQNRFAMQTEQRYYITPKGYFYSNRLAFFLAKSGSINDINQRIETYFDELIIDEIQDIAGRDFNFLEEIMLADVKMLFVGDFYQHTFDTSRDGVVNKNLFKDKAEYETRFTSKGFKSDTTTLLNSWRCSQSVCTYIKDNIGIDISSNRTKDDDTKIYVPSETKEKKRILNDDSIVKLHYQNGAKYGFCHKNWGETKGEDHYQNVCVLLNKSTSEKFFSGKLDELPPSTKNKLYVAITRARGDVYFINE